MWDQTISAKERSALQQRIEILGNWLRTGEPAQNVSEDLVGHQLRGLLVDLRDAIRRKHRAQAIRKNGAAEDAMLELARLRLMRERP